MTEQNKKQCKKRQKWNLKCECLNNANTNLFYLNSLCLVLLLNKPYFVI